MANYGPARLDFSPIANLGNTFLNARRDAEEHEQKQQIRQTLASLGTGERSYDDIGKTLLSLGELNGGLGFLKLGQEEKLKGAQAAADREAYRLIGGNSPTYSTSTGTPRANIDNGVHVAETEEDVQRLERAMGQNTAPDLDKVVRTVYGEAGNQGAIGQAAVANVIANRAQQSGMTPTDVVLAKGQFEPWSDPTARARMEALDPNSPEYKQIAEIAQNALSGRGADPTGGADHFYAPKAQAALGRSAPAWDNGAGRDIGDHRFFRLGYGPQSPVRVAQADIPAAGAREAQSFAIPGQAQEAVQSPRIANLERALANPNLSENARRTLQARLDREYKLFDENNKKTELQRNYEAAVAQGFDGTIVDYQTAVRKAGATNVNVDASQKAQTKFDEKLGEEQAKRWGSYMTTADEAQTRMADIEQMRELSRRIGSQGSSANGKLLFGPYLEAAGINIDGLSDLQVYDSLVKRLAPQMRAPGSGSTSDVEYKGFIAAIGPLSNNPSAREMILDTFEAATRNDLARGDIASRLATGEISRGQAEKELRSLPNPFQSFREFRKQNPDLVGEAIKTGRVSGNNPSSATNTDQGPAPVTGAQKAPDGNWYVPDPNRSGKYLQVQQ